jgi:hypothetical protein
MAVIIGFVSCLQKVPQEAAGAPPVEVAGVEVDHVVQDGVDESTRLQTLESELKRLRQDHDGGSVTTALAQVRTLALRVSTSNGVLVAALETLYDAAVLADHVEKDHYKMALKACRENDAGGPLHALITRLVGTDSARKAQIAVDSWKKTMKKAEKENEKGADDKDDKEKGKKTGADTSMWSQFAPLLFQGFSGMQRGRGRGRYLNRMPPQAPRACYLCRSTDHFMAACPLNVNAQAGKVDHAGKSLK